MSFRKVVEPEASVWRRFAKSANLRALIHGMEALDMFPPAVNRSPADVADLLADMVDAGELRPVALDMNGPLMSSVRAFRGISGSAGGKPSGTWNRAEAHMWTYEVPR